MASVRTILHMANVLNWVIKQMDVKNALLHGDLHETVFTKQPDGFVDKEKPDHVWGSTRRSTVSNRLQEPDLISSAHFSLILDSVARSLIHPCLSTQKRKISSSYYYT